MEDNEYRHILPGTEYEKYFSKPTGKNEDIKLDSELKDTVAFLPKAIYKTSWQVKAFCKTIKSKNVDGICSELWHWLRKHVRYHKDDKGKEQIRSPRRSFYDRQRGIDCDDYTVFISACLCELQIPHILRVAKYTEKNGFQHIYPIVPTKDGNYITVDCVVSRYNYEVPPIETIDQAMDLQFLDGIDDNLPASEINGVDAEDLLMGYEDMGQLGKRLRDTKIVNKVKSTFKKVEQNKVYQKIRKGVHAINRVNPATALLRAGILASLKLNILKVASQLRYAYLSPQQAQSKNFDMDKFNRLVGVNNRLQKIFYGAGGKEENYKAAILKGKGNQDKEVMAGLGAIDTNTYTIDNNLSQILGIDSYNSEMQEVEGVEGLGEPATGAAIAAATSIMTAIAGLLKGIGSLRKKPQASGKDKSDQSNGNDDSASSDPTSQTPSSDSASSDSTSNNSPSTETPTSESSTSTSSNDSTQDTSANANAGVDNSSGSNTTETPAETSNTTDANSSDTSRDTSATTQNARGEASAVAKTTTTSPFQKVKTWAKANPIAAGAAGLAAVSLLTWAVVAYVKSNKKNKEAKAAKKDQNVSGFSKKKKHMHKHHKHSKKSYYPIRIQRLK